MKDFTNFATIIIFYLKKVMNNDKLYIRFENKKKTNCMIFNRNEQD